MSAIKDDSLFKIYLLAADGAYVNKDSHKAGLRAVAEAAVKDERGVEYREACVLAMAIYKRRYMTQSPQFGLCPDTVGVITQIDNMVAGLFSDIEAAVKGAAGGEAAGWQQRLKELLDYYAKSGDFTWKVRRGSVHVGDLAGAIKREEKYDLNYICIDIDGKQYKAHRLVFAWCFGVDLGDFLVDHIDGDGLNNRLSNLRIVDGKQNNENKRMLKNNTSGYMGVCWAKKAKSGSPGLNTIAKSYI